VQKPLVLVVPLRILLLMQKLEDDYTGCDHDLNGENMLPVLEEKKFALQCTGSADLGL
jgi:hypothetical protein